GAERGRDVGDPLVGGVNGVVEVVRVGHDASLPPSAGGPPSAHHRPWQGPGGKGTKTRHRAPLAARAATGPLAGPGPGPAWPGPGPTRQAANSSVRPR